MNLVRSKNKALFAQLCGPAVWRWAKMLSRGLTGSLTEVPPIVWARRANLEWTDEDTNPGYRHKGEKKQRMASEAVAAREEEPICNRPHEGQDKLRNWSAGFAPKVAHPLPAPHDVDPEAFTTYEKTVRNSFCTVVCFANTCIAM